MQQATSEERSSRRRYSVAVKLTLAERQALSRLTALEALPASAVLRRLLLQAVRKIESTDARERDESRG